jgi:hypothetical protein
MTDRDSSQFHTHRDGSQPDDGRSPRRRVALAPDLRSMPARSARAWAERMRVRPLGDGRYAVDSESGATYAVDPAAGTCTCPDATIRGSTCKHLRRVAIEITTRRVPPPDRRRVTCAGCGEETFVPPADDQPALCPACRVDPGTVVVDRETGDRLVVTAVTDRRAREVTVPGTDTTVADYHTNEGYPRDDVVVEASYLADLVRRDAPRQYAFPRSRLRRVDDAALVE